MRNMRLITPLLVISALAFRPESMMAQQGAQSRDTTTRMKVADSLQQQGGAAPDSVQSEVLKAARAVVCKAAEQAAVAAFEKTQSVQQAQQAGGEAARQAVAALPDSMVHALDGQGYRCVATSAAKTAGSLQQQETAAPDSVHSEARKVARTAFCKAAEQAAVAAFKEKQSVEAAQQAGLEAGRQAMTTLPDSILQVLASDQSALAGVRCAVVPR